MNYIYKKTTEIDRNTNGNRHEQQREIDGTTNGNKQKSKQK